MSRRVEIISEQQVAKRAMFRLVEAHLRHERFDGSMSEELVRISFERGDSVAALLHDPTTDAVVLVEQFRYPTLKGGSGWMLELPAGIVEHGEDIERQVTIKRELLEEIGYEVGSLDHICTFYPSPGASSERLSLYYGRIAAASKVAAGGGSAREGEDIRLVILPLHEALDKLATGAIADAKTIIALQWLKLRSA